MRYIRNHRQYNNNGDAKLTARAYLREEFPMAVPFLKQPEKEKFTFSGPVASYAGIGRFVMGLLDEIEIVKPEEFKVYVRMKVGGGL